MAHVVRINRDNADVVLLQHLCALLHHDRCLPAESEYMHAFVGRGHRVGRHLAVAYMAEQQHKPFVVFHLVVIPLRVFGYDLELMSAVHGKTVNEHDPHAVERTIYVEGGLQA